MRTGAEIRADMKARYAVPDFQQWASVVDRLARDVPDLLAENARLLREAETWHKIAREEGLRLEALRSAVDKVRALHTGSDETGAGPGLWCPTCEMRWPCSTAAALPVRDNTEQDPMVGYSMWLDRESWGLVIDGLIELRAAASKRKAVNSESTSDVRADACASLVAQIGGAALAGVGESPSTPEERSNELPRHQEVPRSAT